MNNKYIRISVILMFSLLLMSGCLSPKPVSTEPSRDVASFSGAAPIENEETVSIPEKEPEPVISESDINNTEMEEIKMPDKTYINDADISWIDPDKPMVALSFDDGPVNPVNESSSAMRIQKALTDGGMHATFFYWGNSLNNVTRKEIEAAYEAGFEIANHTKSHPDLSKLTPEEVIKELDAINTVLTEIAGEKKFLLRPPYLALNDMVKETVDVPLITCGLDTKDWANASTEEIIKTVMDAAKDGSLDGKIVLMHETYKTTAEAVEYLVPALKELDYQVVTISELFKVRGKELEGGKVYTHCSK